MEKDMRVLFIQENAISELIGFCCLSAYLKEQGHKCELILLTHTKYWLKAIQDFKPDLIGFSVFTGMQDSIYKLIRQIKNHFNIPVIIGGPHPTFYPRECFEDCRDLDMLCRGDGEETILKLVNSLRGGLNYAAIPGLWVRQGNKVIENSISPLIKDVNSLPLPDRDIYFRFDFLRDFPLKRFISGYGCPYKCSYCNEPFFEQEYSKEYSSGKKDFMRRKSVDRIIEEIKYVKDTANLKRVHFSDDLFSTSKEWLKEFADKYPKIINVPFSCNLRFDNIDVERAGLLKKAMCYAVQAGIESGNDKLRNEVIGKQLSKKQILDSAEILRKNRIKIYTTNIIGLPGEDIDNALETIMLNQKIRADYIRINALIPFPKTGIVDYAIKNGCLPADYSIKDLDTSNSLYMHCKTPFADKFMNISCLFYVFVRFRIPEGLIRMIIGIRNNPIFRAIGFLNLFQDARYFQIDILSGIRFYLNTIFRAKENYTMHWVPGMKKKN